MNATSQRRGSWAGYVSIEHGDFDELCDLLLTKDDGVNVGWNIHSSYIDKLSNGNTEALRRFKRALKVKMVTGKGYFFFVDKVNELNPVAYTNHGLKVKASNLCVAPETMILTDAGHIEISSLVGENVNIWNGSEWSEVEVVKTGENQELIKVNTDCGQTLECTPNHKFYVSQNYWGEVVEKRAYQLSPGDKLIKLATPIIEGSKELRHAYVNGFYSGDGCFYEGKSIIYLYNEKRKLFPKFKEVIKWHNVQEIQDRETIYANGLEAKFFVPDASYSVVSRVDWLSGLLDADGCLLTNGESQTLQIGSIEVEFLKEIQLMLQTLGVQSKVKLARAAGAQLMPKNNGTMELGIYSCKDIYRLLISGNGINQLLSLGLSTSRLNITKHVPNRNCERFVTVVNVETTGRLSDTYCFTEPKKHMGVFNGILTGQCSEIALHSNKNNTFTCVLASMNLAKYDEWKDTDAVYWSTIFLDCVAQEFIQLSNSIPKLDKVVSFTEKGRAIGLGQMGLHTMLQLKRVPFESLEAHMLSNYITKKMQDESFRASEDLAKVYGEPEWCVGTGKRNTHTMAIAPTKSTSLIMGGVSEGINPDPSMMYVQTTAAGEVIRINPVLLGIMKERSIDIDQASLEIQWAKGSVQGLSWLSDKEKEVFKTAFEMDMDNIVRMASARQRYVDQAQSLNLFFSTETPEEKVASVHKKAFLDKYIKSLYYIYSMPGIEPAKDNCIACT